MRNQEAGETINHYIVALRLLNKICKFIDLEEHLIGDRIVCDFKNSIVRDRLLGTEGLTLEITIKICQVDELPDNSRLLEKHNTGSSFSQFVTVGMRS